MAILPTGILYSEPRVKPTSVQGLFQPGCYLYFYLNQTTTPTNVYADVTLTTPLSQPVFAAADGRFPPIYMDPAVIYRVQLYNSVGALLEDQPYVVPGTTSPTLFANLFPQTPGELVVGVTPTNYAYPTGNVLRYGLIPNDSTPATADANTAALRALISYGLHNTGWTGNLIFPNTTGADTYFFSGILDFRPGIYVELNNCTLSMHRAAPVGDESNSGFIMAFRNFSLRNGYVVVDFTTAPSGIAAIFFGARGADGTYFVPIYDSTLSEPMGNIVVANVRVTINTPQARCIEALGGLQDVTFENVWMDGQSVADGFYYEFGWANDAGGVLANRQTSHAHNLKFRNIKATNLMDTGTALGANGAYNIDIDGLFTSIAGACCAFGFGESYFYRPWSAVDDGNVTKRTVTIRNVVGKGIKSAGISIQGSGATSVAGGYLAATINALAPPALYVAQSDLVTAVIEGFMMNGTSNNYGISVTGAARVDISNGRTNNFARGVSMTNEVQHFSLRGLEILNCSGIGIFAGAGFSVWSPARPIIGEIVGCFIAGSSTAAPGTSAAIAVGPTNALSIRNNRFGFEINHDGFAETTQSQAVNAGTTSFGVVCDNNYVAGTSGGAVAYALAGAVYSRGCTITNAQGITTTQGIWENTIQGIMSADLGDVNFAYDAHTGPSVLLFATALTAGRTVTLNTTHAVQGDRVRVVRTGLGAFNLVVGSIKTIIGATAAFVEGEYDGAAWKLIGYGTL